MVEVYANGSPQSSTNAFRNFLLAIAAVRKVTAAQRTQKKKNVDTQNGIINPFPSIRQSISTISRYAHDLCAVTSGRVHATWPFIEHAASKNRSRSFRVRGYQVHVSQPTHGKYVNVTFQIPVENNSRDGHHCDWTSSSSSVSITPPGNLYDRHRNSLQKPIHSFTHSIEPKTENKSTTAAIKIIANTAQTVKHDIKADADRRKVVSAVSQQQQHIANISTTIAITTSSVSSSGGRIEEIKNNVTSSSRRPQHPLAVLLKQHHQNPVQVVLAEQQKQFSFPAIVTLHPTQQSGHLASTSKIENTNSNNNKPFSPMLLQSAKTALRRRSKSVDLHTQKKTMNATSSFPSSSSSSSTTSAMMMSPLHRMLLMSSPPPVMNSVVKAAHTVLLSTPSKESSASSSSSSSSSSSLLLSPIQTKLMQSIRKQQQQQQQKQQEHVQDKDNGNKSMMATPDHINDYDDDDDKFSDFYSESTTKIGSTSNILMPPPQSQQQQQQQQQQQHMNVPNSACASAAIPHTPAHEHIEKKDIPSSLTNKGVIIADSNVTNTTTTNASNHNTSSTSTGISSLMSNKNMTPQVSSLEALTFALSERRNKLEGNNANASNSLLSSPIPQLGSPLYTMKRHHAIAASSTSTANTAKPSNAPFSSPSMSSKSALMKQKKKAKTRDSVFPDFDDDVSNEDDSVDDAEKVVSVVTTELGKKDEQHLMVQVHQEVASQDISMKEPKQIAGDTNVTIIESKEKKMKKTTEVVAALPIDVVESAASAHVAVLPPFVTPRSKGRGGRGGGGIAGVSMEFNYETTALIDSALTTTTTSSSLLSSSTLMVDLSNAPTETAKISPKAIPLIKIEPMTLARNEASVSSASATSILLADLASSAAALRPKKRTSIKRTSSSSTFVPSSISSSTPLVVEKAFSGVSAIAPLPKPLDQKLLEQEHQQQEAAIMAAAAAKEFFSQAAKAKHPRSRSSKGVDLSLANTLAKNRRSGSLPVATTTTTTTQDFAARQQHDFQDSVSAKSGETTAFQPVNTGTTVDRAGVPTSGKARAGRISSTVRGNNSKQRLSTRGSTSFPPITLSSVMDEGALYSPPLINKQQQQQQQQQRASSRASMGMGLVNLSIPPLQPGEPLRVIHGGSSTTLSSAVEHYMDKENEQHAEKSRMIPSTPSSSSSSSSSSLIPTTTASLTSPLAQMTTNDLLAGLAISKAKRRQ